MIYILYNDKSNQGKPIRMAEKYMKRYKKRKISCCKISLLEICGMEKEFHQKLTKDDQLLLIGGDGTFHYYLNHILEEPVIYRIFVLASGRGNDLARDYKRRKPFEITHLVHHLPNVVINKQEKIFFMNGIGMGIDSMVCNQQLLNAKIKKKESYFKVALRIFKNFSPYPLDIEIDGQAYHYDRVWFFVCNHGCYFGGGMKITPKAIREDEVLDVCIVQGIKLWSLLLVFPLVFLGFHRFFRKKYIHFFQAKSIKVTPQNCNILQADGEVYCDIQQIEVHR